MSPDASTLMIFAALLTGGAALVHTGWRMELASVRAAELTPADDEQEADDAPVQAADL